MHPGMLTLKRVLTSMKPTGPDGFEGLIGEMLASITGQMFRLASSGLQFGIDGASTNRDDRIYFEAKRYDGRVARVHLISKIADLGRNESFSDVVWVLAATAPLGAQLASDLHEDGVRAGVQVIILDWNDHDVSPLAVALAMAGDQVDRFLLRNLHSEKLAELAIEVLAVVRLVPIFAARSSQILKALDIASASFALAQSANKIWIKGAFSSEQTSIDRLGKVLSPQDPLVKLVLRRDNIGDQVKIFLDHQPNETICFIIGNPGCGKSWLAANAWSETEDQSYFVVISPLPLKYLSSHGDIENFLILQLITQTGEEPSNLRINRWRRRLNKWKGESLPDRPNLVVLLDDIDYRPELSWSWLLDSLSSFIFSIGGRLIVTSSASFFNDNVHQYLRHRYTVVEISELTTGERDAVLRSNNLEPRGINAFVLEALCNMKMLSLALKIVEQNGPGSEKSLSLTQLAKKYEQTRTQIVLDFRGAGL